MAARSIEQRTSSWALRGLAVLGALGVTAIIFGGQSSDKTKKVEQRHPTAVELDQQREYELGISVDVSEFPVESQGVDGAKRYCDQIGGSVLVLAQDKNAIDCVIDDQTFTIKANDDDPENDGPMEVACLARGGDLEGVAVNEGNPFSIPACVVESAIG